VGSIRRRVAVKLIRVERGTVLYHLEAEQQVIALMNQTHIAKPLDAGTTDSGSPYLIMELLKGVPLIEYCDSHRLNIPDLLKLFVQSSSAAPHAHQTFRI
jgi:serine/threonine protein kinase